ncbi:hypothetical protein [Kitasatospora sp. NPDC050463]|uniref:hypothetical protein n=1 Tax=Kitasatospora sp. NPDC050463 TaxID=3155786 RepID=UPI0033EC9589
MHRLHAAADTIEYLKHQLPRAYREEGLPGLEELAAHTRAVRDCQDDLLDVTAALHHPHAQSADRAVVRSLTSATAQLGEALGALGRATAMAGRLYEVDGIGGPRAEEVRERGSQQLNLALSRTRLALDGACEDLRRDARSLAVPVSGVGRPAPRVVAATAHTAAGPSACTVASLPALPGQHAAVAGRRR